MATKKQTKPKATPKPKEKKEKVAKTVLSPAVVNDKLLVDLKVSFNGEVFETSTDSIKTALRELTVPYLKTKVVINIKKGDKKLEFVLFSRMAKKIFATDMGADVFANKAYFLLGITK
jgi:hypothetical protein